MAVNGSNFVDYVKIHCAAGHGGAGSVHLHRSRLTAKGGPDGGDGGRGGNIYLKYKRHVKGGAGGGGSSNNSFGDDGKDEYIDVPLGTVVRDAETQEIIFEVTDHGQEIIIRKGGLGGRGNSWFKNSVRQTPRYAQPGIEGEEGWNILELKVLADVGLVGFPNAGKSTLLSVISAAKPKIADYAFTTLVPNLGIVAYRDNRSFVMADIPGIIEGANEGKGLGIRFLRHIERNSTLLFLVPADADDIAKEYEILLNELALYNPELLHKDRLLAISKSDMLDDELQAEVAETLPKGVKTVFFSSVAQQGLMELKDLIWQQLNA